MNITARGGLILVALALLAGCGSSVPTSPTDVHQTTPAPSATPPPTTNFPPLSGASRTFVYGGTPSDPVGNDTKASRFVLYDNGAFVLQYVALGSQYRGKYTEANGVISFEWEGWSVAGPWGATGTLNGDSLAVHYNSVMQWTDFQDAVYTLVP